MSDIIDISDKEIDAMIDDFNRQDFYDDKRELFERELEELDKIINANQEEIKALKEGESRKLFDAISDEITEKLLSPYGLGNINKVQSRSDYYNSDYKEKRAEVDKDRNRKNGEDNSANERAMQRSKENGEVYTGKPLDSNTQYEAEHLVSANEIVKAKPTGFLNDKEDLIKIVNSDKNLQGMLNKSANASKGDRDLREWANDKPSIENQKKFPNAKTNAEVYGIDIDKVEIAYKKSKDFINTTNLKQFGKMALAELGKVFISVFVVDLIVVVKEAFCSAFMNVSNKLKTFKQKITIFFEELKLRMKSFFMDFPNKIKKILGQAAENLINQYLSFQALVSQLTKITIDFIKNIFKSVAKFISMMFDSVVKIFKILINPNVSFEEKTPLIVEILIGAGIAICGILIADTLKGLPFGAGEIISLVLVAIASAMVVYYLKDKKEEAKRKEKIAIIHSKNSALLHCKTIVSAGITLVNAGKTVDYIAKTNIGTIDIINNRTIEHDDFKEKFNEQDFKSEELSDERKKNLEDW